MPPLQTREAGKIPVRRHQFAAVLDCQRGQVGVRNQVGCCLSSGEHLLQNLPVAARRPDDARAGLIQPALDTGNGLIERQGMIKNPRIGADPDVGRQNGPAEADRSASGQLFVPPGTRPPVVRVEGVFGAKQQCWRLRGSTAVLAFNLRQQLLYVVQAASRLQSHFAGCTTWSRPARRASLTTRLKGAPCLAAIALARSSTSSSMEMVVRMKSS